MIDPGDPLQQVANNAREWALAFVILFCRIGGCLMLAPGFSAGQIPVQLRAYLAVSFTFVLTPHLYHFVSDLAANDEPLIIMQSIIFESLVGVVIGLLSRLFILSLDTLFFAIATMLGFSNPFGIALERDEPLPPLTTFVSLFALCMIFVYDLHCELIRGLSASYTVMPPTLSFNSKLALAQITSAFVDTFRLSLRVASPFMLYAITVNLAMSLINRLTPQITIFYVASPFVLLGGLALLLYSVNPMMTAFITGYEIWLRTGGTVR